MASSSKRRLFHSGVARIACGRPINRTGSITCDVITAIIAARRAQQSNTWSAKFRQEAQIDPGTAALATDSALLVWGLFGQLAAFSSVFAMSAARSLTARARHGARNGRTDLLPQQPLAAIEPGEMGPSHFVTSGHFYLDKLSPRQIQEIHPARPGTSTGDGRLMRAGAVPGMGLVTSSRAVRKLARPANAGLPGAGCPG